MNQKRTLLPKPATENQVVKKSFFLSPINCSNPCKLLLYTLLLWCSPAMSQTWQQLGADLDGEAMDDWSGESVSLSSDGSVLAIGATLNNGSGGNAGHVRVYAWNGTAWQQRGADIDGEAEYDHSGSSVSLSSDGSVLAIGATGNDGTGTDAGHVRVYA